MKDFLSQHPATITLCLIVVFYAVAFTAIYFSEKANTSIAYGQAITISGDTITFYGGTLEKPSLQDYRIKDIKIK